MGKPLSKGGVLAHFQADVIAQSIGVKINGISPKKESDGNGNCFIELGNGKAGYASGNLYAEPKPVGKIKIPSRFRY